VKTCQTLARHSTPSLTIGIYAKASVADIDGAVESLPDLGKQPPSTEAAKQMATGTDGKRISDAFSPSFPLRGFGIVRNGADDCEITDASPPKMTMDSVLENAVSCGQSRDNSDYRRWESNPHGGSPPEDFKSSASAASLALGSCCGGV
jgi:hypothetical protein